VNIRYFAKRLATLGMTVLTALLLVLLGRSWSVLYGVEYQRGWDGATGYCIQTAGVGLLDGRFSLGYMTLETKIPYPRMQGWGIARSYLPGWHFRLTHEPPIRTFVASLGPPPGSYITPAAPTPLLVPTRPLPGGGGPLPSPGLGPAAYNVTAPVSPSFLPAPTAGPAFGLVPPTKIDLPVWPWWGYAEHRNPSATKLYAPFCIFPAMTAIYPAWCLFVWLRRRRRQKSGRCPMCAYDLRGANSGVCPECGAERRKANAHHAAT
jgi:hypothetical protein